MIWSNDTKQVCLHFSQSLAGWAGRAALTREAFQNVIAMVTCYQDIDNLFVSDAISGLGEIHSSYLEDKQNMYWYKRVHEMVAIDITNTLTSMDTDFNG